MDQPATTNAVSDGALLKHLETTLDELSKTTNWIAISVLLTAFSAASDDDPLQILGFELPKKIAGIAMFAFIFCLNFYILKLSINLISTYGQVSPANKDTAGLVMKKHNWICNPFAKSGLSNSNFIDDIGYSLFTILWWLGFSLAFKLSYPLPAFPFGAAIIVIGILYVAVGLATGFCYMPINKKAEFKNNARRNISWAAIFIGIFIFFLINLIQFIRK